MFESSDLLKLNSDHICLYLKKHIKRILKIVTTKILLLDSIFQTTNMNTLNPLTSVQAIQLLWLYHKQTLHVLINRDLPPASRTTNINLCNYIQPISGLADIASTIETVDPGSIPGRLGSVNHILKTI